MSQAAKANEPSMEEILASIRRIISDDDAGAPKKAEAPVAKPAEKPAPAPSDGPSSQDDIDALLASFDEPAPPPPKKKEEPKKAEAKPAAKAPEPKKEEKGGSQDDIDALLAAFEAEEEAPAAVEEVKAPPVVTEDDVLDLVDAVDLEAEGDDLAEDDGWGLAAEEEPVAPPAPAAAPPPVAAPVPAAPAAPALSAAPVAAAVAANAESMMSPAAQAAVSTAFSSLGNLFLASNARTIEGLVEDLLRPMLKSWLDDNLPQMVERMVKAEIERVTRLGPR